MSIYRRAIQFLSVLGLCALAVAPNLAGISLFALPLIPLAAIHYWAMRDDGTQTGVVAFICGLFVDAATGGPFGYWALMYLAGHFAAALLTRVTPALFPLTWIAFGLNLVFVACLAWILAALLADTPVAVWPFLKTIPWVFIVYPLIALVLRILVPRRAVPHGWVSA